MLRAIIRSVAPHPYLSRKISRAQRIGTRSAGIGSPSASPRSGSLCSHRLSARRLHSGRLQIGIGGRDRSEQVADFKSGMSGRHHFGIGGPLTSESAELCREMGLLATSSIAIDGSKFMVVNNCDRN